MIDPMSEAIDEAVTGRVLDRNGVRFVYAWYVPPNGDALNDFNAARWVPHFHCVPPGGNAKQETFRPAKDRDKEAYPEQWRKFEAGAERELSRLLALLEGQVVSLRKLIGNEVVEPPKKKGRPPKVPQSATEAAAPL